MKKMVFFLAGIIFISCHTQQKSVSYNTFDRFHYTTTKRVTGKHGVVVSAHPLASRIGINIMKEGGNAFDAGIAVQLALAVVYPNAGNIGGGGFLIASMANGKNLALDYREKAPLAATRDMYLDKKGKVVEGKSINGHLSCGVPGTVAGIMESMRYARLPFKKLIQPAIDLAEKGFIVTGAEAASFNSIHTELDSFNTSVSIFQKRKWKEGDTLVQADLANTLKRIRDHGKKGFYRGMTAALIVGEMKRGGGMITLEDLESYKAKWRIPENFTYKGYTVMSMPMPSSGGIMLHQMMKMVENRPLPSYGFESAAAVQLMTEVERRAFADRAEYMGDNDFYHVPVKKLCDSVYLDLRMKDYSEYVAGDSRKTGAGAIIIKESDQTTHLSIIDSEGNAVSVTTTLNNSYGSKIIVGGAGFFLNDEMDDFSAKPGNPNLFGAVGGVANAIEPGKRMLSSMAPTIVLQNEKPFLVIGTPGGTTIPTSVFQTLVDIIDFKMSSEDAVNKPKFHHQWLPDQVDLEKGFPENIKDQLVRMGYKIAERKSIGRTELIRRLPDGSFEGIADRRGEDGAEAY